jgi:hypothetical protein
MLSAVHAVQRRRYVPHIHHTARFISLYECLNGSYAPEF